MTKLCIGNPELYGTPANSPVNWLLMERDELPPDTLTILRKFSSTMPRVPYHDENDLIRESFGGGYFLNWRGYGLVIDPGFNFIENFGKYTKRSVPSDTGYRGLSVADIDGVLLTHAHSDHTHDFEPLIDLFYERNRQGKMQHGDDYTPKKVAVFLNHTAHCKFQGMLVRTKKEERVVSDLVELDLKSVLELKNSFGHHVMTVRPQFAEHEDSYGTGCIGLTVDLLDDSSPANVVTRIGITSDTGWYEGIADAYKGVKLLVPHVGFIQPYDIAAAARGATDELREHIKVRMGNRENTHLGLCGTFDLINGLAPDLELAVLSEFNQQSGNADLRLFAAVAMQELAKRPTMDSMEGPRCIAGTLGLTIKLAKHLEIKCESQKEFVDIYSYRQTANNSERRITCCCSGHSDDVRMTDAEWNALPDSIEVPANK
jgi:hypothetical protein